jgi:hypothetical protein
MRTSTAKFLYRLTHGLGIYCLIVGWVAAVILGRTDIGILCPIGATLYFVSDILKRRFLSA